MITIKTVETDKELAMFVDFLYVLFEGNPNFVPPLFDDEMNTLSKKKNPAFEFCEAKYFMAFDEDGKMVGRVAAILNTKANKRWQQKQMRFGWLDFVDNEEVCRALMNAVEEYAKEKGMEEIVGPLGFTDLDKEGMLVEGFDQIGTMMTSYGAPHYREHFEKLDGYKIDARYRESKLICPKEVPQKYMKVGKVVESRYNLHVRKPSRWSLLFKDDGKKIFDLLNETYRDIYGYNELSEKQRNAYIKAYIPFANPEFITLIEDWNTPEHKMIGFGLSIPSLAYALQKTKHGKYLPFGWWHLAKTLFFTKKSKIVDLLLIGVLPEYRSKGANALLFCDLIPIYVKYGCEWGETQVQLEDNLHATSQWGPLDPIVHKRRNLYKKVLTH